VIRQEPVMSGVQFTRRQKDVARLLREKRQQMADKIAASKKKKRPRSEGR